MNNVKKMRQNNVGFLAQLIVDQKFYDQEFRKFNEDELREKLGKAKTAIMDEKKRLNLMMVAMQRKGQRPTDSEMQKYNELNGKLKKAETEVDELEILKQGKDKGIETIDKIRSLIGIIDKMTSKEKDELNNL